MPSCIRIPSRSFAPSLLALMKSTTGTSYVVLRKANKIRLSVRLITDEGRRFEDRKRRGYLDQGIYTA
jgi:hypothetical protein